MFTNVNRPSAVDVLRPFAVGDQFYANTTTTLAKRAIGATNDVYTVSGGVPVWSSSISLTTLTVVDSGFTIVGSSDATKTLKFEVDAQSAGADLTINSGAQTADRTLTIPVLTGNATLAALEETQTFTGTKTFSAVTTVSNTTASTSYLTGALLVSGGVGIAKDLIGNQAFICSGSAGAAPNFAHIRFEQNSNIGYLTAADASTNVMPLALRASVVNVTNGTTTATSSTTGWVVIGDGSTAATNIGMGGGALFVGANAAIDTNSTAGNTRLMIYDVDNGTLERVSVGAADSGGVGYKVLRIPN